MTPKKYLSQVRLFDLRIKNRRKQKDSLYEECGISSIDYSKDKIQGNSAVDAPFVNTIAEIIELEQKIDLLNSEYLRLKDKIIGEILGLENAYHIDILYMKYVEYKTLDEISVEMDKSYQYIVELHGRALKKFGETYKNL